MKKYIFLAIVFITSFNLKAQEKNVIYLESTNEDELYSIQNNGWAIVDYEGIRFLGNFSNTDYIFVLNLNCKGTNQPPSFFIEFSNNYKDGNSGGIDFDTSQNERFQKRIFIIDGKEFESPFIKFNKTKYDEINFTFFKEALKNGKKLTIQFYEEEVEVEEIANAVESVIAKANEMVKAVVNDVEREVGEIEIINTVEVEYTLNREIEFKLENSQLLNLQLDCFN